MVVHVVILLSMHILVSMDKLC